MNDKTIKTVFTRAAAFFVAAFFLSLSSCSDEPKIESMQQEPRQANSSISAQAEAEEEVVLSEEDLSEEALRDVESIGYVTSVKGSAMVSTELPAEGDNEEEIEGGGEGDTLTKRVIEGAPVFLKDLFETGPESMLTIEFNDDSLLTVSSDSRIRIEDWVYSEEEKKNRSYFKFFAGTVRGILKDRFPGGSEMSFETPTAVTGVKGSDITVWIEDGESLAAVREGHGYLRHLDKEFPGEVRLIAGYMSKVRAGQAPSARVLYSEKVRKKISKIKVERKGKLLRKLRKLREKKLEHLKELGVIKPGARVGPGVKDVIERKLKKQVEESKVRKDVEDKIRRKKQDIEGKVRQDVEEKLQKRKQEEESRIRKGIEGKIKKKKQEEDGRVRKAVEDTFRKKSEEASEEARERLFDKVKGKIKEDKGKDKKRKKKKEGAETPGPDRSR